jgi:hypothetical protein
MRKTETNAAVVKAAYIRPSIACFSAASECPLCAASPFGGNAGTAVTGGELSEEGEEEPESGMSPNS